MSDSKEIAERRERMKQSFVPDMEALVKAGELPASHLPQLPANQAAQPVSESSTPTPSAPPGPDPNKQPAANPQQLIFGKYKSLEEAERGYWNATNTLSSTLDKATRLEQELTALKGTTPNGSQQATLPGDSPGSRGRVNPAAQHTIDWSTNPGVVKFAEESGIDPSVLAGFAQGITQPLLESVETIKAQTSLSRKQTEAEVYMRRVHPESFNHIAEITNFVQTNPVAANAVSSLLSADNPQSAMEVAWTMYASQLGLLAQQQAAADNTVAEGQRAAAMAAGTLPSSPSTPPHAAAEQHRDDPAVIDALKERVKTEGIRSDAATELRRRLLGGELPAHLRTWENTG